MEKRLFIAVMISIAFLFAWSALIPKFFPDLARPKADSPSPASSPARPVATAGASAPKASPNAVRQDSRPTVPAGAPVKAVQADREIRTVIQTSLYTATFSNRGGQLVSFQLKKYKAEDGSLVDLVKRRDPRQADFPFAVESGRCSSERDRQPFLLCRG